MAYAKHGINAVDCYFISDQILPSFMMDRSDFISLKSIHL